MFTSRREGAKWGRRDPPKVQEKKRKWPEWVRDVGGDEKGPGGSGRGRTSLVASVRNLVG